MIWLPTGNVSEMIRERDQTDQGCAFYNRSTGRSSSGNDLPDLFQARKADTWDHTWYLVRSHKLWAHPSRELVEAEGQGGQVAQ